MTARRAAIVTMLALLVATPLAASATEIGPETDWCAAIHALGADTEIVLRPGEYQGSCTIRSGGTPAAPLVIRAKNPADPPRIIYHGNSDNVLNIRAGSVVVRGLHFGPTHRASDGIRIYAGSDITIEDCRFSGIGGIAIVANHGSVRDLRIRRNQILESQSTAMYFGCHDGAGCIVSDLLVEHNYVHGVEAPHPEIGYGIQIKLNSTATIRDNVIVATKGPGIMVYGAGDPAKVSVIERNFVGLSRTSSAIVVGGGPAIVRNNVAVSSAEAGINLLDYAGRGLLSDILVAHNTVYDNALGGIVVIGAIRFGIRILGNAAHARATAPAFPSAQPRQVSLGNVDCSHQTCFASPAAWDFSPTPGSPLITHGRLVADPAMPADDYFRRVRGTPATIGAIEQPNGPITLGIKP